jgi:filamentous hemagglutinin family protein
MAYPRLGLAFLTLLLSSAGFCGVVTDGSVGPRLSLNGNFEISQSLGARAGGNLFHSFARFSLERGESAHFTGDADISHVIARVTGGEASHIDGVLRSSVGKADFYFINPAGVVFGEHAQVEVPAAFHVSAADELRFAGGAKFSASQPEASRLSVLAPEAYGFLGDNHASIRLDHAELGAPGQTISLSAPNLRIDGSVLYVPNGKLSLVAVGGKALNLPLNALPEQAWGKLSITGGEAQKSSLNLSGKQGGTLAIRAGDVFLRNASVSVDNTGDISDSARWLIDIRAQNIVLGQNSRISSNAYGGGRAGSVRVAAEHELLLRQGGQILSSTYGAGAAGEIEAQAGHLLILGWGDAGHPTGIGSEAVEGSQGNAGQITLTAGRMALRDAGVISSKTSAAGAAGAIHIKAGSLEIDGSRFVNTKLLTGIVASAAKTATGDSGQIEVEVQNSLRLTAGEISSSVYGRGQGGSVSVSAGRIDLEGLNAGQRHFTGIDAATVNFGLGAGAPGRLDIRARQWIAVRDGARISTRNDSIAPTPGNLQASPLSLQAPLIQLEGGVITTQSTGNLPGSPILIVADRLLATQSHIGTQAQDGDGGPVRIRAGLIWLDHAQLTTSVLGVDNGNGGNIALQGQQLVLNGGFIQANTAAQAAHGGRIFVDAGAILAYGNRLQIGGKRLVSFTPASTLNLIQAAAPNGISGDIVLSAPQLSLSGVLAHLGGPQFDAGPLSPDYCALGAGSSLTRLGRGGLPPKGSGLTP